MKYRILREQQLDCDIDTAWKFFSSPGNLSLITPPEMNLKVEQGEGIKNIFTGMEINYTLTPLFKIPMKWKTKITQVDYPNSFTDLQLQGPYKYWNHHHEFLENEDGTLMKDTVEYQLPFGFLGSIVHQLLVRKKLKELFDYRHGVIGGHFHQKMPAL